MIILCQRAVQFLERSNALYVVRPDTGALYGGLSVRKTGVTSNRLESLDDFLNCGLSNPEHFNFDTDDGRLDLSNATEVFSVVLDNDFIEVSGGFYRVTETGDKVQVSGDIPSNLILDTDYFVIKSEMSDRVKLALSLSDANDGVDIDLGSSSGNFTITIDFDEKVDTATVVAEDIKDSTETETTDQNRLDLNSYPELVKSLAVGIGRQKVKLSGVGTGVFNIDSVNVLDTDDAAAKDYWLGVTTVDDGNIWQIYSVSTGGTALTIADKDNATNSLTSLTITLTDKSIDDDDAEINEVPVDNTLEVTSRFYEVSCTGDTVQIATNNSDPPGGLTASVDYFFGKTS